MRLFSVILLMLAAPVLGQDTAETNASPHVVFLAGEEEYRSEESMPLLGHMLQRDYGCKVTICFSLDMRGYVDPNNYRSLYGTEALEDADLIVLFTHNRNLVDFQMKPIADYVAQGKPVVGFRSALQPFRYRKGNTWFGWNEERITEIFGLAMSTHHGQVKESPRTAVTLREAHREHPVLRGVEPFDAVSWLYHVDGKQLKRKAEVLLEGKALYSNKAENFPRTSPLAWVKEYPGNDGRTGRVFYTSLGHPDDFKIPAVRRLAINGIVWALGLEDRIPEEGANPEPAFRYAPNPSGFGRYFKFPRRPKYFHDPERIKK